MTDAFRKKSDSGVSCSTRRRFLAAGGAGLAVPLLSQNEKIWANEQVFSPNRQEFPVRVISSGNGLEATKKAYEMIVAGEDVLDGVVAGVNIVEADPRDMSVGYGGLPNERGVVQLDAACMHGPSHQAGAVACLENIKYPSQVAKLVLWRTDHVLLVGSGALEFARAHGFPEENLLTDRARKVWLRWKENLSDKDDWLAPEAKPSNDEAKEQAADFDHQESGLYDRGQSIERLAQQVARHRPTGTIHCAGMDGKGNLSCTTTTSGLAFKIPGRVGDSPIIGAGLYCDNEIGSCGSTGRGEANLQNQCSFAAVELMRTGMEPVEAGLEVLRRVSKHAHPRLKNEQGQADFGLQFYLLRKDGKYAGVTMRGRGKFAITDENGSRKEDLVALY